MAPLSVQDVRDLIIDQLANGTYAVGDRLPTSRDLAKQIGSHRNTVAKAYRALADLGLVTLMPGSGTYVADLVDRHRHPALSTQIRGEIESQVFKARRLGIAKEELQGLVGEVIEQAYLKEKISGAFIECNISDVAAGISDIETYTGLHLEPMLLHAFESDPRAAVAGYQMLVTSLFHIKQVSELTSDLSLPNLRVLGVHTQPDEQALYAIAQIPAQSVVCVIVSDAQSGTRFVAQVNAVTTVKTEVLILPSDEEIRHLAGRAKALICSRSRAKQVRSLELSSITTIVLEFHVTQQSSARILDVTLGRQGNGEKLGGVHGGSSAGEANGISSAAVFRRDGARAHP